MGENSFFPWREPFQLIDIGPTKTTSGAVFAPAKITYEYEATTGHRCKLEVRYDYINSNYTLRHEEFFVDIASARMAGLPPEWISVTSLEHV
jgi:hypothetical protein